MFFGSFSWSFVYVSLPFHIQEISTLDPVTTLRWTGWILGISPLATVVTAPLLGRMGGRGNPKTAFEVIQYLQGGAFFAMAMTWFSSDSRTPLRRPSMVGRMPIFGSEPIKGNVPAFVIPLD